MQQLLHGLTEQLSAFIEDRVHLVLWASGDEPGTALLLLLLAQQDAQAETDLHIHGPTAFVTPKTFVEEAIRRVQLERDRAALALQEAGRQAPPPLWEALQQERSDPALRLRLLLQYCRSLVPLEEGAQAVVCLAPLQIHDAPAWRLLLTEALFGAEDCAWWSGLKVIVRDLPGGAPRVAAGHRARIAWCPVSAGTEALDQSLEADVGNPSLPDAVRTQTRLLMAFRALGRGQGEDARRHALLALHAARAAGDCLHEALALTARGDVERLGGTASLALRWYEAALAPAGKARAAGLLLALSLNLGRIQQDAGNPELAALYFEQASKLSIVCREPTARVQALEHWAVCLTGLGRGEEGAPKLREALTLTDILADGEGRVRLQALLDALPRTRTGPDKPPRSRYDTG